MPGLVGIITRMPPQMAKDQLAKMLATMQHSRGYTSGVWCDATIGVYVGWTALKNSFASRMPVSNERGDAVLVFSGEEYPTPQTLTDLGKSGHRFDQSGADYLVHLYEDNPEFFAQLNGRFHGLLVDRARGIGLLFNDRYGIGRLYTHQAGDAFYFAAEAKAILVVRPELRSTSDRSLGEFVACGCTLENRTLFRGIQMMPPATVCFCRNGCVEQSKTYFDPRQWDCQSSLDPPSFYQELKGTFAQVLPRYFRGEQRIGMSLTGGLDTRMILAWHKAGPATLPCYSFGGMFRDCQDVILARRVAKVCGQSFQLIPVGSEFLSQFAEYAERTVYLSDGCASVRCASDLYANERAAGIAPVRMTGNYGSEILRRLRAFKPGTTSAQIFTNDFLVHIRGAKNTFERFASESALSFIAFRQVPWHHYGLLALEQTQLSVRSPYLDNDLVKLAFRAPNGAALKTKLFRDEDSSDCLRLIQDGNRALAAIRTDRGVDTDSGRPASTIRRTWLEFTFKAEYAYDYGMPQWLARIDHVLSPFHLERMFLGRHKFNHFRVWYRDELSAFVREILLDSRSLSRPYIDRGGVEQVVSSHLKGDRNYTSEIHNLVTLELFHRLFIDTN